MWTTTAPSMWRHSDTVVALHMFSGCHSPCSFLERNWNKHNKQQVNEVPRNQCQSKTQNHLGYMHMRTRYSQANHFTRSGTSTFLLTKQKVSCVLSCRIHSPLLQSIPWVMCAHVCLSMLRFLLKFIAFKHTKKEDRIWKWKREKAILQTVIISEFSEKLLYFHRYRALANKTAWANMNPFWSTNISSRKDLAHLMLLRTFVFVPFVASQTPESWIETTDAGIQRRNHSEIAWDCVHHVSQRRCDFAWLFCTHCSIFCCRRCKFKPRNPSCDNSMPRTTIVVDSARDSSVATLRTSHRSKGLFENKSLENDFWHKAHLTCALESLSEGHLWVLRIIHNIFIQYLAPWISRKWRDNLESNPE